MAEKPSEEGYVSVVDEEPEIFRLLKWDTSHTQKQQIQNEQQQINQQQVVVPVTSVAETQHTITTIPLTQESTEKEKNTEKKKGREDVDPFTLDDDAFMENYRLTKNMLRELSEELKPVMPRCENSIKCNEVSTESKVLAAIQFYATGKYQKVSSKSDAALSQYFVSIAVQQVTEAMNNPAIVQKYIHFPHLKEERDIIKARFYIKYGIPNVVGCVDCTHVPIAKPDTDQRRHLNKAFHSKKVQIICDSDLNIISVDATRGGSFSHNDILGTHAVKVDLESLNHSGEPCWLIGGIYYTQKPYIMTPIPKVTKKLPVNPEKYYMTMHNQIYNTVTDTIKHLKSRWKCLQASSNKQFDPSTVTKIVIACCILHNICNKHELPVVAMTPAEERLEQMKQKVANGNIKKHIEDSEGVQARAKLIERLWSERRTPENNGTPKKRVKKDKVVEKRPMQEPMRVEMQPIQPQPQPAHQTHHHQLIPHQMLHPHHMQHHEDPSKRPRLVMNTPSYSLGFPPGWGGHYPQH